MSQFPSRCPRGVQYVAFLAFFLALESILGGFFLVENQWESEKTVKLVVAGAYLVLGLGLLCLQRWAHLLTMVLLLTDVGLSVFLLNVYAPFSSSSYLYAGVVAIVFLIVAKLAGVICLGDPGGYEPFARRHSGS